jgi:CheY-like chemotaxis protein
MRALIAHVLRAEGFEVCEAADADQTVSQWREVRPDVIVLDQRMSPTTGMEVAESILAAEPTQVIFLFTAFVDAEIRAEAKRVGIAACVSKDQVFEIPELVRAQFNRE